MSVSPVKIARKNFTLFNISGIGTNHVLIRDEDGMTYYSEVAYNELRSRCNILLEIDSIEIIQKKGEPLADQIDAMEFFFYPSVPEGFVKIRYNKRGYFSLSTNTLSRYYERIGSKSVDETIECATNTFFIPKVIEQLEKIQRENPEFILLKSYFDAGKGVGLFIRLYKKSEGQMGRKKFGNIQVIS